MIHRIVRNSGTVSRPPTAFVLRLGCIIVIFDTDLRLGAERCEATQRSRSHSMQLMISDKKRCGEFRVRILPRINHAVKIRPQ